MRPVAYTLLLAALLLVAACDLLDSPEGPDVDASCSPTSCEEPPVADPCPPSSVHGLADFLPPLTVGDTLVYDFSYGFTSVLSFTSKREETGTVQLTALSSACAEGSRTMTLQQVFSVERRSFDIIDTDVPSDTVNLIVEQVDETTTVTLTQHADSTIAHPFASDAFPRFYSAAEDTMTVEAGTMLAGHPGCGGGSSLHLVLVKGRGLVQAYFSHCLGSAAVSSGGSVTLQASD